MSFKRIHSAFWAVFRSAFSSHFQASGAKLLFGEAADKVSTSVSKKTDYLVAGEAAGRKLTKSWQLGVSAIGEAHLQKLPSRRNVILTSEILPVSSQRKAAMQYLGDKAEGRENGQADRPGLEEGH